MSQNHHPLAISLSLALFAASASCSGPSTRTDDVDPGTRGPALLTLPTNAAACTDDCPSWPALAPDGSVLVTRDEIDLVSADSGCKPPTHWVRFFYEPSSEGVLLTESGLRQVAERPLDGFEALVCSELLDGQILALRDDLSARVRRDDGAWLVELLAPDFTILAQERWSDRGIALCPSAHHRVVAIQFLTGLPSECASANPPMYGWLRY